MRRLIPVILILILLSACAPRHDAAANASPSPRDAAPSDEAIEAAVAWAEALTGEASFPTIGGYQVCESDNRCTDFVSNAYGYISPMYGSAYILWEHCEQHPGDYDAPRGSLLFFDRNDYNPYGHVALCTGDQHLVEAGYPTIRKGSIGTEGTYSGYLGWAWPPAVWALGNDLHNPGG